MCERRGRPQKYKIDLCELRLAIRNLKYYHPLFRLLREELSALGYWKSLPRGDPRKGYDVAHSKYLTP